MKRFFLALALIALAGAASAETKPSPPGPTVGTADTKVRLKTLGYKDAHDLRPGLKPGEWQGRAVQGNVEKSVTVSPRGAVTAR